MVKKAVVMFIALGAIGQVSAQQQPFLARFKGAVGVIPASSGFGTANPDGTLPNVRQNIVRGVPPGAGPWRIEDLKADVDVYGHIEVIGKGLLLASGNSIGQNANQRVFATLICEAAAPFTERNTSVSVPLEPNGDFRIDDMLSPAPTECASPVLLIRTSSSGAWFAAGLQRHGDNE